MQDRAGVSGAGDAAAAEADRRHPEVAPVLLHHEVGRGLRDAEQRVGRAVERHRGVDALEVAMVLGQLEARLALDQRQPVRAVAVELVGGDEDERRIRAVRADRLEQIEGPPGVHREVRLRLARGPVVRGLGGGVDDELDGPAVLGEEARDRVLVADVDLQRAEVGELAAQGLGDVRGRSLRAEEAGAHVVLDPDDVVALGDQAAHRLGADEAAGSGDDRDRHAGLLMRGSQGPGRRPRRCPRSTRRCRP